jgi:hypothetical protein
MMVTTIGIDPHKATHTAVAIDDDETVLGVFDMGGHRERSVDHTCRHVQLFRCFSVHTGTQGPWGATVRAKEEDGDQSSR